MTRVAAAATTRVVLPLRAKTFYTSSPFGPRCLPVAGSSAWHLGTDLEAQRGAPILAAVAGTVTRTVNPKNGAAGYVVVRSTVGQKRYDLAYVHMAKATAHVRVGQKVRAGQKIAVVGSSGAATSPHLHLEVWKGGFGATAIDPVPWLRSHGVSITQARIFDEKVTTPKSCRYYSTAARLNIRAKATTASAVRAVVPRNTVLTSRPGKKTAGFVPVTVRTGGRTVTGWASASYVSPVAVASSGTVRRSFTVTRDTWMRTGPATSYPKARLVRRGTVIRTVYEPIRGWWDVSVGGTRGLVAASALRARG